MKTTHLLFILLLASCSSNMDSNLALEKKANLISPNSDFSKEEKAGNSNLTSKSNKSKKLVKEISQRN